MQNPASSECSDTREYSLAGYGFAYRQRPAQARVRTFPLRVLLWPLFCRFVLQGGNSRSSVAAGAVTDRGARLFPLGI